VHITTDEITIGLTSAAVGIVFGSIHCTAWQFQFPSYIEQLLWRISAISVTGGPILIGLFRTLANKTSVLGGIVGRMGFVLLLNLYIFARLALLVLSFMTLRSLPPTYHQKHVSAYAKKSECWQEVKRWHKMPQMITRVSKSLKNAGITIQGAQRLIIVLQLTVIHLSNASPTFSDIFLPFIFWHFPFSNFATFTILGCSFY
jgi:hypothetical protein